MIKELIDAVDGVKRFIVTLISIFAINITMITLLFLFVFHKIAFADISGIISSIILTTGGISGAYLGVQTMSDHFKIIGQQKNPVNNINSNNGQTLDGAI